MKFIADSMLGRLARWLRLVGYDTLYYPDIEDSLLLRIAREENRTLLTRDTRLVKIRGLENYLLLKDNDTFEQLKNVILTFNLFPHSASLKSIMISGPSRCSLCNQVLESVPKEHAEKHVPEYVFQNFDSFKHCKNCGRFYWKGTHPELQLGKLAEIIKFTKTGEIRKGTDA